MIRGLDASSVQGALPFHQLTELRFVILKAQEGNDGFDPWFERNMRAALVAGVEAFAYCFAFPLPENGTPGRNPREQAKLFVERVYRFREMRGRPIFLDFEWPAPEDWPKWGCTAAQISEWCRVCAEEVERLTGIPPIIYTYPWWWRSVSAADVSWAARYGLWLAAYVSRWPAPGESPKVPQPWRTWLFWQWDGNGGARLPNGVDSDFCVFNGTEEELHTLTHQPHPVDWDIVMGLPPTVAGRE
jgi:lysozyme